jgi:hypothetical protein
MKCDSCGKKIETTFLNKLIGTYAKNAKGKKKAICPDCQRLKTREEIKAL